MLNQNFKVMKKYFLMLLVAAISMTTFAQTSKKETATIQTNGVCGQCKNLFDANIPYLKGVTDYSYDQATAKMTVSYNPQKTTIDEIRKAISNLGYNADNVKADTKAREKLPACCRVESGKGHSGCSHDHSKCGGKH